MHVWVWLKLNVPLVFVPRLVIVMGAMCAFRVAGWARRQLPGRHLISHHVTTLPTALQTTAVSASK